MSRSRWLPYACIALAVGLANSPGLLHLVDTDPLNLWGSLVATTPRWLPGIPTADPNAGFLMQALGHLVTSDWLSGQVPWWNPYEGIGVPFAADMQSGAFFPPTLLFGFPDGLMYLEVLLELVAGWCTFALLVRLGVGRTLATAGGVAFGLCGTFAWFAIEPIRVLSLLPLCLLGVERILSASTGERRWGWRLLAVGLAGSFLAGFPETFAIDTLFVAVWAVARMAGPGRRHLRAMAAKLAAAAAAAVALALPLVVAFLGYLGFADTGSHGSGGFAFVTLRARDLAQLVLPYSAGPIDAFHTPGPVDTINVFWGNVGGYLDATLLAAACVGAIGRRNRILRLVLVAWVVVCLARTYGFPPAVHLLAAVPGLRLTAFYRYADPTWELAAVVLAVLGLDDIARRRTRFRWLVGAAAAVAAASVGAALVARSTLDGAVGPTGSMELHRHRFATGSLAFALGALTLMTIGGWLAAGRPSLPAHGAHRRDDLARRRWGRVAMAAAVSVESLVLLGFTYLSAPVPVTADTASVTWLQANLGTYRFATLGPIQPNYGSYYRIAEVNVNELPLPRAWTAYVATRLDPNIVPFEFTGGYSSDPEGPTPAQEFTRNLPAFEAVGVRYVVVDASGDDPTGSPFPSPGTPPWPAGPRLVHRDGFAEIWELPDPAPAFSLEDAPGCTAAAAGWDEVRVSCPHPATLVRRVQYAPGWTADIGGRSQAVAEYRPGPPGLFQTVTVPAGTTTIRFTYLPPGTRWAFPVAVVAWLGLVVSLVVTRRNRRVDRSATGRPSAGPSRRR
ncbi:MAG: hypothetical protein ABSF84_04995 [Acidimicrobiales bacterium]